ncbi:MAG: SRPBCC family protein [Chloroflexota bacterium]|nr:SRPBCC family protein [Chloroflexota bacterium]
MKSVEAAALVDAQPKRVWDLYADVPGSVRWVPFVEEILYISGPAGLGQVYRERTRLGGIRDVAEWRVIEWDPPRRQVQLSTDKRMDARLVIEVEPVGVKSRVRQRVILRSRLIPPLSWPPEQLFAMVSKRGIRLAVRAAQRHLERDTLERAGPPRPPPVHHRRQP